MDGDLARAYALFKQAAKDLELPHALEPEELAGRLRSVSHRVLDALDGRDSDNDDPFAHLEGQSRDIADDLRRVERLMKERLKGLD